MYRTLITPRFSETDALGHINNTVVPVWFEEARTPIFRCFIPTLDHRQWNLILAGFNVDYLLPTYYGEDVEIRSGIHHIGNSSLKIWHQALQGGKVVAQAEVAMVHYDYEAESSTAIGEEVRLLLAELQDPRPW
ncbi:acyl-CoA thioester hydrolase [Ferrimonas sediminum]|uniref:Acyl-CoA thioester hydrolase n=1 Tax=Ferrimonas sediminum TaxID=718193 RepID=A0A1G8JAI2_9GAMM|nr:MULTISPECIES: thioesterase family protein [Ferrimonas]SDI28284.1 acyl-CoA thioester hydrolase [Ferrimonas sediminum]